MTKRIFNPGIVVGIMIMTAPQFGAAAQVYTLPLWLSSAKWAFSASCNQHFDPGIVNHKQGECGLISVPVFNATLSRADNRQEERLRAEPSPATSEIQPANRKAREGTEKKRKATRSNTNFLYGIAMLSVWVIHQKPTRRKG